MKNNPNKNEKAICKLAVLTLDIHIIHANKICIINIIIFTIQWIKPSPI